MGLTPPPVAGPGPAEAPGKQNDLGCLLAAGCFLLMMFTALVGNDALSNPYGGSTSPVQLVVAFIGLIAICALVLSGRARVRAPASLRPLVASGGLAGTVGCLIVVAPLAFAAVASAVGLNLDVVTWSLVGITWIACLATIVLSLLTTDWGVQRQWLQLFFIVVGCLVSAALAFAVSTPLLG